MISEEVHDIIDIIKRVFLNQNLWTLNVYMQKGEIDTSQHNLFIIDYILYSNESFSYHVLFFSC